METQLTNLAECIAHSLVIGLTSLRFRLKARLDDICLHVYQSPF